MVRVPFGSRELMGYVMAPDTQGPAEGRKYKLKAISEVVVPEPLFGPDLVALVEFISTYYMYPPGLCVKEILPGGLSPKLRLGYRLTDKGMELAGGQGGPAGTVAPGESAEATGSFRLAGSTGSAGNDGPVRPADAAGEALGLLAEAYPEVVPATKVGGLGQAIRGLVKNGLAEAVNELDGRGMGFSYEWYLTPKAPPETLPRLGPKEKELYALVKDAPPTPLAHYRQVLEFDPLLQAKNLVRKDLLEMDKRERFRDDPSRAINFVSPVVEKLTEDQARAVEAINGAIDRNEPAGFLLFGVTGSGKTEVYLRAAERVLAKGQGVLWLAPEIALTMGLEGRLKERFPNQELSILHSALTPGQRHDHWVALRRGRTRLALGARSAVFAPIADLGLIVVDEEHDWAYKQDEGLKYNGRDLAAWRAQVSGATLVLGSATPSLESYHRAMTGKLTLLRLHSRPGSSVLPEVNIIDLKREGKIQGHIAREVRANLKETFERGEQALMFINRRGLANIPLCLDCGTYLKCPHCSLSLTLHSNFDKFQRLEEDFEEAGQGGGDPAETGRAGGSGAGGGPEPGQAARAIEPDNLLICHSCGYRARPPSHCPTCRSKLVRYLGVGTESLIREMEKSFGKKGLRLDTDSSRLKGGLKEILEGFSKGEADFLVGTQMAAKGHDFSNLTMVGVVEADLGLSLADFRAAERTYQLLSQVSGRAGRRERPGKVFIQTLNPDHYAITSARDHDYESFFENEIAIREELGYPPFSRLALIRFSGPEPNKVEELAQWTADRARELVPSQTRGEVQIFGPAPCALSKLKEKYRHQIMVRAVKSEDRQRLLRKLMPEARKLLSESLTLTVDVDPYHLL
jgi:primosomal protein N' (replication factor Y)